MVPCVSFSIIIIYMIKVNVRSCQPTSRIDQHQTQQASPSRMWHAIKYNQHITSFQPNPLIRYHQPSSTTIRLISSWEAIMAPHLGHMNSKNIANVCSRRYDTTTPRLEAHCLHDIRAYYQQYHHLPLSH